MRVNLLSLFGAGLLLLSSCSKEKDSLVEQTTFVSFTGRINNLQATTSVGASTNWNSNDKIGVFMVNNGSTTVVESNANREYSFNGSQFVPLAGNEMFFPVNDTKVDFIAYYPYAANLSLTNSLSINVSNQSNQAVLDILYAKSNKGGAGYRKTDGATVPLIFNHKLSKIVIKPVAGIGLVGSADWNTMCVGIQGMKLTALLDLSTGTLSSKSGVNDIVSFTNVDGQSYQAIVIPQEFSAAGSLKFSFQIGQETYIWSNPANESFEEGKEYIYTITINKTGVVLAPLAVNDWVSVSRSGIAN